MQSKSLKILEKKMVGKEFLDTTPETISLNKKGDKLNKKHL